MVKEIHRRSELIARHSEHLCSVINAAVAFGKASAPGQGDGYTPLELPVLLSALRQARDGYKHYNTPWQTFNTELERWQAALDASLATWMGGKE